MPQVNEAELSQPLLQPSVVLEVVMAPAGFVVRFLLSLIMLLTATRAESALPEGAVSEYLSTVGGGLVFSDEIRDPGKVQVGLTLKWVKRPPKSAWVVAEFSNPRLRGTQTVERAVEPSEPGFMLYSPEYRCVANNSLYVVTVSVYSDKDRSNLLGTHEQKVSAAFPPAFLQAVKVRACGP